MKKILKLTILTFLLILSFSCEKDDSELNIESTINQEKIIDSNVNSRVVRTECEVMGNTSACAGQTFTYTYTSDISNPNITWSWTSGISIISGQGTNTATFQFNSGFSAGSISAIGVGSETCSDTIDIICGGGNGNNNCSCPNLSLACYAYPAPIGTYPPDWRFRINDGLGVPSGWTANWSINHGTISGGSHTASAYPQGVIGDYFTVTCTISKSCSDGYVTKRTISYTNQIGGSASGNYETINLGDCTTTSDNGGGGILVPVLD